VTPQRIAISRPEAAQASLGLNPDGLRLSGGTEKLAGFSPVSGVSGEPGRAGSEGEVQAGLALAVAAGASGGGGVRHRGQGVVTEKR